MYMGCDGRSDQRDGAMQCADGVSDVRIERTIMSGFEKFDYDALEKLIPVCLQAVQAMREGDEFSLRDGVQLAGEALGIGDVDEYALSQIERLLKEGIDMAFDDGVAQEIAALFTGSCKPIMEVVLEFARGNRDATALVTELNKAMLSSSRVLEGILGQGLGVPPEAAAKVSEAIGPCSVSVFCFAAAFKIYESAAHDYEAAREQRELAEKRAAEAVSLLRAERHQLDQLLSAYLLDRLVPFAEGVTAMDAAVLEGDDDGFISANGELWELFGHAAQYSNASEFEALMASDEPFRL